MWWRVALILSILCSVTTKGQSVPQCVTEVEIVARDIHTSAISFPSGVTTALLDNDVHVDIAVTSFNEDSVMWFRNDGTGSFTLAQTLPDTLDGAQAVVAGNLDGDTDVDLVVASQSDDSITWFQNTDGDGTFVLAQVVATDVTNAYDVIIADVDGDMRPDLVASGYGTGGGIAFYTNSDGGGTFVFEAYVLEDANNRRVAAADYNGDGRMDIAVAERSDGAYWFENVDGSGTVWVQHPVTLEAFGCESIAMGDVDGDGDPDLATASRFDSKTAWYENVDGNGTFGPQQIISAETSFVQDVVFGDLDNDNDLDVVACSLSTDSASWFENEDGVGGFGPRKIISTDIASAIEVALGDLDGDLIPDVVAAGIADLVWLPTAESPSRGFVSEVMSDTLALVRDISACDLDGDGDLDVAVADNTADRIVWFENLNGRGRFADAAPVVSAVLRPWKVVCGDLDLDGDLDLAIVSNFDDRVGWVENQDGGGTFGPLRVLSDTANSVLDLDVVDMDRDGDLDLVYAARFENVVAWFENTDGAGTFSQTASQMVGLSRASRVKIADLDGDNDYDVAVLAGETGEVVIAENVLGNATLWGPPVGVATFLNTDISSQLVVGDVDGDGDNDVFVSIFADDQVYLILNTLEAGGAGLADHFSTAATTLLSGLDGIADLVLIDFDYDGDVDVLVSPQYDDHVLWYENTDGMGTLVPVEVSTGDAPTALAVGDIDSDGDNDVLVFYLVDLELVFSSSLTRGPFARLTPTTRTLPSVATPVTHEACKIPQSFACLAHQLALSSHCVRDRVVLDPGVLSCASDRAAKVTRAVRIEAAVPGATTFDCQGGVLFLAAVDGSSVGDVELVGVTVVNTGAGTGESRAVPGLRADGVGATIRFANGTLSGGVSAASASLLSSGIGGCLLAASGGHVVLEGSSVLNCTAATAGGGMAAVGAGSLLTLCTSTLRGNTGGSGGGLAALEGGVVDASDVMVVHNEATRVGGGVWVQPNVPATPEDPFSTIRNGVFAENKAAVGGGVALGKQDGFASSSLAVSDIPLGEYLEALGPQATAQIAPPALVMSRVEVRGNRASNVGGGIFACDGRVDVQGAKSSGSWVSGNAVGGSTDAAQSSATAFVCATLTSGGMTPSARQAESVPWIRFEVSGGPPAWDGSGVHGPVAGLEWVSEPTARVEAGGVVAGSIRSVDWLGELVEYTQAEALVSFDPTPTLGPVADATVLLGSSESDLPVVLLKVTEDATLPENVTMRVSLTNGGGEGVLPVAALVAAIELEVCGPGRGGVVEGSGLTSCVPCVEGTEAEERSLAPCLARITCPANTVRLEGNGTAIPCVCERGFWIRSGLPNEACEGCPDGGNCAGGSARPVASPGFFSRSPDEPVFVKCTRDGCVGENKCQSGYEGYLCSACEKGYFSESEALCTRCPPNAGTRFVSMGVALVVATLAAAAFVTWSAHRSLEAQTGNGTGGEGRPSQAMVTAFRTRTLPVTPTMVIFAAQVISIVIEANFGWSTEVRSAYSFLGVLNVDVRVVGTQCSLASFHTMYVVSVLLPMGLLCLVLFTVVVLKATVFVSQMIRKKKSTEKNGKNGNGGEARRKGTKDEDTNKQKERAWKGERSTYLLKVNTETG